MGVNIGKIENRTLQTIITNIVYSSFPLCYKMVFLGGKSSAIGKIANPLADQPCDFDFCNYSSSS